MSEFVTKTGGIYDAYYKTTLSLQQKQNISIKHNNFRSLDKLV